MHVITYLPNVNTFFHLIHNKFRHVITYLPNFAPPNFAARGIPKNTPHGTMEGHTAYIYMLSVYPFQMELSSFSLYTKHTLLHSLILFVKYGKG